MPRNIYIPLLKMFSTRIEYPHMRSLFIRKHCEVESQNDSHRMSWNFFRCCFCPHASRNRQIYSTDPTHAELHIMVSYRLVFLYSNKIQSNERRVRIYIIFIDCSLRKYGGAPSIASSQTISRNWINKKRQKKKRNPRDAPTAVAEQRNNKTSNRVHALCKRARVCASLRAVRTNDYWLYLLVPL